MRKYYLKPKYIEKIRPNTYKRVEENVQPNILKRNFKADKLNEKWTTDITYLIFKNKRLYLSNILDLYDKKVVAYKISKFNNNQLAIDTLNEALSKRKDVHGLIIQSDQGFQYTSFEYKSICESNEITISMSRKGTLIDDSPIVEDWIIFYNTDRLK